jgi:hypothetical protein
MLLEAATGMESLDVDSIARLEAAGRASIVNVMPRLEQSNV